jgi:hypothetical protein
MDQGKNFLMIMPPEILGQILCYLTPTELKDVCMVNHHMEANARVLLYTSIHLASNNTSLEYTLRLLTRGSHLGPIIRSATLKTIPGHQSMNRPWIQPSIFTKWTNLKTLKLIGYPFSDPFDSQLFQAVLEQNCKLLAQVTFVPTTDLEIAGITGIQWGTQNSETIVLLSTTPLALKICPFFFAFNSQRRIETFTDKPVQCPFSDTPLLWWHSDPYRQPCAPVHF